MLKMISIAFGALVCAGCATCGSSDATFTCASWNGEGKLVTRWKAYSKHRPMTHTA